jgi:glycosyltransferase involved in cell wall biosynthesis
MSAPLLSIVVPVHDEEAVLAALRERLEALMDGVAGGAEVVLVDDGSTDRSAELARAWMRESAHDVCLVSLARNFGMEIAMSAGLDHVRGDWTVLMHADLQDPPELVPEMLRCAVEQDADVVYARRIGRDESPVKRALATAFYKLMERLARVPYQGQAGDFRLMSRRVVDAVRNMPERRRFLRGMVAWTGFRQVPIEYRRAGRAAGRGASYPDLLRLGLEALAAFSDVPLSLAAYLGIVIAACSAVVAFVLLVLGIVGVVATSAVVWTLIAVLFLGGAQLVGLGIIGRYLARVHEEALHRPLYLVNRVERRDA